MKLREYIIIDYLDSHDSSFSFNANGNSVVIRLDTGYCDIDFGEGEWYTGHKIDDVFEFMEIVSDFIKCWRIFEELKLDVDKYMATRYVTFCVKRKVSVTLETYNDFISTINKLEVELWWV